ncbi:MAG: pseudouridine synthase [[Candidatus Thermochlorobacteriaceae] bacterium GBChlB]|jgi:23S rRNA pseudouridine2605 synthase/16S rRNA pseudouridine516 synthase|nr:MAG: pseudouridine synthase [[Candidatus Thermochlorobacteriaceae] bacterium GBChlB]
MVRLNKFISMCGAASRRKADELIEQGEVIVNGKVITELGFKVHRETDEVMVSGKPLREPRRKLYILLHKPKDAITTTQDDQSRRTVIDLLGIDGRVYPVGRLDRNTTGVLLLTNDGDLATRLMHPSYGVEKEYIAALDKKFTRADLPKLTGGMRLKDTGEKVSECAAEILGDGLSVWLKIHEGKNRQVHRMFWSLGYDVKKLERVRYAGLTVGNLRRGEWRRLLPDEIRQLYKQVRLEPEF